ncbi:MAG TPA: hypothetical protein VF807_12330 [Ktedonobacterales bacterium]
MSAAAVFILSIAIAIGLLGAAWVLAPLARPRSAQDAIARGSVSPEVTEALARDALREVEFDYRLGNLAAEDYGDLRTRYEDRAIEAMKAQLTSEAVPPVETIESGARVAAPAVKAKPPTPPRRGRPIRRGGRS